MLRGHISAKEITVPEMRKLFVPYGHERYTETFTIPNVEYASHAPEMRFGCYDLNDLELHETEGHGLFPTLQVETLTTNDGCIEPTVTQSPNRTNTRSGSTLY